MAVRSVLFPLQQTPFDLAHFLREFPFRYLTCSGNSNAHVKRDRRRRRFDVKYDKSTPLHKTCHLHRHHQHHHHQLTRTLYKNTHTHKSCMDQLIVQVPIIS